MAAAPEMKTTTQESSDQFCFPYQKVDGLEKIYIGIGPIPTASFVFETVEKTDACRKALINETRITQALGKGQSTNMVIKNLFEVVRTDNISDTEDERVISLQAKTAGTVGAPMTSVHQLINRAGTIMQKTCGSKEIRAIALIAVDHPWD